MTSSGLSPETLLKNAAARLSHEIRNSLAGIAGALHVLSDRLPEMSEADGVFDRIRQEISRIESSVVELSHFANPTRPALQQRNLHDVIDRALSRTPVGATTHVRRDYASDIPTVRVDDGLVSEALRRIFVNAQEAMPSGGTLSITTSWEQGRVVVTVRDTGTGIRETDLPSIFEPFYSGKTRGLGLGLAITRRFVEANGGSISARPSSPSGGAEFILEFPDATLPTA